MITGARTNIQLSAFLFLPSFFTVAAVNLVCIHLAYATLVTSGDMSRSALYLTIQFLIPSLTAPLFLRATRHLTTRQVLLLVDLGNLALVAALIAANRFQAPNVVVYAIVGLLGLSIFVLRSGRLEFVKLADHAKDRASLNSIAQTAIYLGVASGAALVPVVEGLGVQTVACLAALGFFGSAALNLALCPRPQQHGGKQRQVTLEHLLTVLVSNRAVCVNFLFVVATMGLLQSLMQILRIAVPVHVLDGGAGLVSGLQMIMIAAFVAAALLVATFRTVAVTGWEIFAFFAAALAFATISTKLPVVWFAFAGMFLFILFFEMAFLLALNQLVSSLPRESIFGMSIFSQMVGGVLMIVTSTLGAEVYDQRGLDAALGIYWIQLVVLAICWGAIVAFVRPEPVHEP